MNYPEQRPLPPDWIIHFYGNGIHCERCGKTENRYPDFICNAHTQGMDKYDHPDFQLVIHYSEQVICYILNTLGDRVRNGEKFHAGDMVAGIFEDCSVRLDEARDGDRMMLRVIIPDKENRFPENKHCKYPYSFQLFTEEDLLDIRRQVEVQMA